MGAEFGLVIVLHLDQSSASSPVRSSIFIHLERGRPRPLNRISATSKTRAVLVTLSHPFSRGHSISIWSPRFKILSVRRLIFVFLCMFSLVTPMDHLNIFISVVVLLAQQSLLYNVVG